MHKFVHLRKLQRDVGLMLKKSSHIEKQMYNHYLKTTGNNPII